MKYNFQMYSLLEIFTDARWIEYKLIITFATFYQLFLFVYANKEYYAVIKIL